MAGFEPKYAEYGKAGEASSSSDNNTPKSGETATSRRPAGRTAERVRECRSRSFIYSFVANSVLAVQFVNGLCS